jgi:hypothetical protein
MTERVLRRSATSLSVLRPLRPPPACMHACNSGCACLPARLSVCMCVCVRGQEARGKRMADCVEAVIGEGVWVMVRGMPRWLVGWYTRLAYAST